MRIVPNRPIKVKNAVLGGERPLVCVPLVGQNKDSVMSEVGKIANVAADIIELRVDAWDCIEDVGESVSRVSEVRRLAGDVPIILTCRGHWEGGFKEVSEEAKDRLYESVLQRGLVDFVDKELSYGFQKLSELKQKTAAAGAHLIISYHNFSETPSKEFIYSQLVSQVRCGADVPKIAVMPLAEEDVLTLLAATLSFRRDYPEYPLITMSMAKLGAASRIVGCLFGSDLSFGVGSQASAPGQMPVNELNTALNILLG
ncbi:MAG: type I 3-dehydroquinate dehydratase [Synergistaceae bacterium]|nr:type I 3-dehydroquinate dehydratase [Synergistaceae bacterium]MBP9626924.1 type I 3-dehydroquinate dehydratase [Synergistaceae bacterium]MBP9957311.1 type I 3-dehydroquinate dehydratase [Synergistaceae bacterium]